LGRACLALVLVAGPCPCRGLYLYRLDALDEALDERAEVPCRLQVLERFAKKRKGLPQAARLPVKVWSSFSFSFGRLWSF
jgi:hypothetical protein